MSSLKATRLAALNLLAKREHTAKELHRKLTNKKLPPDDIQQVIIALEQENLLNPTRYLEQFLHSRRLKGQGPLRIQLELRERGITEELIEQHLNITDNSWLDEARHVLQKRFKGKQTRDPKIRAQQMRFLHYRGFTHEQIRTILNSEEYVD